ncbi:hypothetical protein BJ322DRAFT_1118091 [Thelephora terrestris]|uniref:Gem-associated protein 2 n=1 Tax=Thelephora terrestris TaxID=56493 RepID=A0A9P6LB87_9AGAM|nr:hypothetical protein BJ322DRAFT_1118091 [Thelephora terrestris]
MSAIGKRKRDECDSSDDESNNVMGKQVLPVADLPFDFAGVPEDGAQYLFTVRRDASLLPRTTRVDNPYATPEPSVDAASSQSSHCYPRRPAMPSKEWRSIAENRFKNLKMNMDQPTIDVQAPLPPNTIPELRNRAGWWAFIAGAPELEWNPPKKPKANKKFGKGMRGFADEEDWQGEFEGAVVEASLPTPHGTPSPSDQPPEDGSRTPRDPTPTLLRLIDEKTAFHLLKYFIHWIESDLAQPKLTETHAKWMFALLTRISDFVSSDDMNLLRNFVRACISLLGALVQKRVSSGGPEEYEKFCFVEQTTVISEQSCWMIISIAIGVWAQRDLWGEVESTLGGISCQPSQDPSLSSEPPLDYA